jgi:hypothetical protein
MWLKITKNGIKIHYLDIIGAGYRIHSSSIQRIDKKNFIFSKFEMDMIKGYSEQYLYQLPNIEKILRSWLFFKDKVAFRLFKNKRSILSIVFMLILGYIPGRIIKIIDNKYT